MTRTVLITGVNGGIGNALARRFKMSGWSVLGADLTGSGNEHCDLFVQGDVSRALFVNSLREAVLQGHARLDCLINNAAIQISKPLLETSEEEWAATFRTNVDAVYHTARCFAPLMADGSIINISSVHARVTSWGVAAYAASKGAVSALTRAMAIELAPLGIRVNAILPGAVDTPMLAGGLQRSGDAGEAAERLRRASPLGKIGSPDDVASLALFLADESLAGNITGQEIVCDGGVLARLASE
ncbi:SDR family oxidoreductase [Geomonas sp.]|uniref:SDR family NAD(P)-dependent oxidoreductase n=1 Tax=Geomonas sp. TaxID=2651584 RepID=UPI002B4A5D90|nr:SDR family oxidoreductase [Geomonas sp.]HJV35777.1 SDR family oxidoreductase [Geomonas sp.]